MFKSLKELQEEIVKKGTGGASSVFIKNDKYVTDHDVEYPTWAKDYKRRDDRERHAEGDAAGCHDREHHSGNSYDGWVRVQKEADDKEKKDRAASAASTQKRREEHEKNFDNDQHQREADIKKNQDDWNKNHSHAAGGPTGSDTPEARAAMKKNHDDYNKSRAGPSDHKAPTTSPTDPIHRNQHAMGGAAKERMEYPDVDHPHNKRLAELTRSNFRKGNHHGRRK